MIELFTLTWPDAFTIVGSVATVAATFLTGYMLYLKSQANNESQTKSMLPSMENAQIHERISGLKDRVASLDGQQKVFATQIENLIKQLDDHNARDVDDFKTINTKVDKLMEIIVEMLKADH